LDELRYGGNWNTFTMWWVHTYPWWSKGRVIHLAFALLTLFLASSCVLLALLARAECVPCAPELAIRGGYNGVPCGIGTTSSDDNGYRRFTLLDGAALLDLVPVRLIASAVGGLDTLVAETPARRQLPVGMPAPAPRPATGLAPLGVAALCAALVYGGIMGVAALHAPRQAPALVRTVPMSVTVRDGSWAYRVLRVTSDPALPGSLAPPVVGHHYMIVVLHLHNLSARPDHVRWQFFALTDTKGQVYPWVTPLSKPAAELYHVMPFGSMVPARRAMDGVLVYLVRNGARHLALLAPGIALVRLE
jgi:hypothetical protein